MKTSRIFELPIVCQDKSSVLKELAMIVKVKGAVVLIGTPNPEQIMLGRQTEEFFSCLKQMDWLMPDGIGLVWASRVLNNEDEKIAERITGLDLVSELLKMAKEIKRPVLIVGGRGYEGSVVNLIESSNNFGRSTNDCNQASQVKVKHEVGSNHSNAVADEHVVRIKSVEQFRKNGKDSNLGHRKKFRVWWCLGYEDVSAPTFEEDEWLGEVIARLEPAVVFVALGAPHQEKWLVARRALLSSHAVRVGLTVGGAFDVLTGRLPRAPKFWQNLGLEWLWRLIQEPHRWRRQLALIKFVGLVFKKKFFRKMLDTQ